MTSFREPKYTIGLVNFHAQKKERSIKISTKICEKINNSLKNVHKFSFLFMCNYFITNTLKVIFLQKNKDILSLFNAYFLICFYKNHLFL